MNLLNIFVIGAIVGLASCDIDCFNKESESCNIDWRHDINSYLHDYCSSQPPFIKCLNKAANKCKIYQKLIGNWLDVATDACTDGSKLNKDIKENMECISETTIHAECFKENDLKSLMKDKILCRLFETLRDCLYRNVEHACGKTAEDSFLAIYEPMSQYLLKICYQSVV